MTYDEVVVKKYAMANALIRALGPDWTLNDFLPSFPYLECGGDLEINISYYENFLGGKNQYRFLIGDKNQISRKRGDHCTLEELPLLESEMLVLLMALNGEDSEVDWRPTETIPEDYYG